jgi:hypothetical protein
MRLNAPKVITWYIALVLGILGLLGTIADIPVITAVIGFWLVLIALVLMLIATATKNL